MSGLRDLGEEDEDKGFDLKGEVRSCGNPRNKDGIN